MYFSPCMKLSYKKCLTVLKKNSACESHLCLRRLLFCHGNFMPVTNIKAKDGKAHMESSIIKDNVTKANDNLGKHIQITSESYRNTRIAEAVVSDIYPLSTTVKGFTLKVLDPEFTFLAGQWVDAFIPNMDTVGGFSICSSPLELKEKGTISLGIKSSLWPPAKWFYNECKTGSELSVRVGGDFCYLNDGDETDDLLLIAGGVGVNPILSMYLHLVHRGRKRETGVANKICLLYSAKSKDELLYKSKIDDVARSLPENVRVQYFTTKGSTPENEIIGQRISMGHIEDALKWLTLSSTKVYICGPRSMIEALSNYVDNCGVPQSRVYFEKWW